MPLEHKDMDRVFELRCKQFLKKMKKGKFYSYSELCDLILENSLTDQNSRLPLKIRLAAY